MEMLRCAYFRKKGKNMFLFFFAIRHTNDCSNEHFQAWVVVEFIPYAHNNKAFFYSVYVFFFIAQHFSSKFIRNFYYRSKNGIKIHGIN